ncbi:MAG: hypothetical protein U0586_07560 [Candidatus Brocadiaceae bacterium]
MFGQLTQYIDQAVQMVKELDEEDNWVRQHSIELTEKLVQQGWLKRRPHNMPLSGSLMRLDVMT